MGVVDIRNKGILASAVKAFEKHEITKQSEGRWLLQKDHSGEFATEVICLWHKRLFVGGDIDDVVFAYGPDDYESRVFWMGLERSNLSYVFEKARIGSGHRLTTWEPDFAILELEEHLERKLTEDERDCISVESQDRFYDTVSAQKSIIEGDTDAWEWLGNIGMCPAMRVFYAHAALSRLCALIKDAK